MDIDERIAQFDSPVDRTGIFSMKWDVADGELPMWVADMDFRTAPAISEALAERVGNGTFGGCSPGMDRSGRGLVATPVWRDGGFLACGVHHRCDSGDLLAGALADECG